MALKDYNKREYHPLPDPEPPKWWEARERIRTALRARGMPESRIRHFIGRNAEEMQQMNIKREEAGLEPVEGMLDSMSYGLGAADVSLAATSIPAFTKTLGSLATPYAAMGAESALGFTDALKGIKDYPEDAPKDWRYRLMQGALPLTALGGGMAATRFVPKTDVPSTLPNKQSKATDIGPVRDKKQFDDTVKKFEEETRIPAGYSDDLEQTNPTKYFKDQFERGEYTILNEERGELGTNPNLYNQSKKEGEPPTIQFDDGTYANANDLGYDLPKADVVDIDKTRRNILKGGVLLGGLASIPPSMRVAIKTAPTVAKTVPAAAGKGFIEMFGTNLGKPNIGEKLSDSLEGYVYTSGEAFSPERLSAAVDEGDTIPYYIKNMEKDIKTSDKLLSKFEVGEEASHIKVLIDDDFNVTSTFKDLKKDARKQAFGQETIHRHLADDANIIEIETIGHTGQKHFKNYGLKPDEIHIIAEYDFDGYVPQKDFTISPGTEFETSYTKGIPLFDKNVFLGGVQNIEDFERYYLGQHGRKINKEVDPGIPYEAGDMGFAGINYYEIDGVPVAVGGYETSKGTFTDAIIIPNQKGIQRLTGMKEEEIGDIMANTRETRFK